LSINSKYNIFKYFFGVSDGFVKAKKLNNYAYANRVFNFNPENGL